MRVVRQPFWQEVCTDGYEIATMARRAEDVFNAVVPRERHSYSSRLRRIEVEDHMMEIIQAYMSIRTSEREDWLAFADLYGLPDPKISERYPKTDGMGEARARYPFQELHFYDRNFEQYILQEAFEKRDSPTILVKDHCVLESGWSQGPRILELRPCNLIGAIAAYITDRFSEGGMFKNCEECGEWFLVADGRAKRAKYCRPACKMRAHRLK